MKLEKMKKWQLRQEVVNLRRRNDLVEACLKEVQDWAQRRRAYPPTAFLELLFPDRAEAARSGRQTENEE